MIAAALLLTAVLQLADALTTLWILGRGGIEKNPALRWLIERAGARAALALKVAAAWGLLAGGHLSGAFAAAPWVAYFLAALYLAIIINNAAAIVQIRRRQ